MIPPPIQKSSLPAHGATLPCLLTKSNQALLGQLKTILDVPAENVRFSTSTGRVRQSLLDLQKENKPVSYPLLYLRPSSIDIRDIGDESAYSRSLTRHGSYLSVNDNQTAVGRVKLIPVLLEYEVLMLVEDFQSVVSISTRWIAAARRSMANFTITYLNLPIDVTVSMGDRLQIPERDDDINSPMNMYELNGAVIMKSYINDPHPDGYDVVDILRHGVYEVTVDGIAAVDKRQYDPARTTSSIPS